MKGLNSAHVLTERVSNIEFTDLDDCGYSLNNKLKNNHTKDNIIEFLEDNGIIRTKFVRVGYNVHKNYQFVLLYKYYLGLKSRVRR